MADLRIDDRGQNVKKRFVLMDGGKKIDAFETWKSAVASLHDVEESEKSPAKTKTGRRKKKST